MGFRIALTRCGSEAGQRTQETVPRQPIIFYVGPHFPINSAGESTLPPVRQAVEWEAA